MYRILLLLLLSKAAISQQKDSLTDNQITEIVSRWQQATLNSIERQMTVAKNEKDSFFYKIISSQKEFFITESPNDGFRRSFIKELFKHTSNSILYDQYYLVEHYISSEGFSSEVIAYHCKSNKGYKFKLVSGNWVFIGNLGLPKNISSVFESAQEKLCADMYSSESLIISKLIRFNFSTKAFLFPCATDYKRVRKNFLQ